MTTTSSSNGERQSTPTIPSVVDLAHGADFAETAGKILDLKGLLRPPSFSGLERDWAEWKFRVDNMWTILRIYQRMKWCVTATDHDLDPEFRGEMQIAVSRFTYGMLVQLCSGKALVTLRLVTAGDGLQAWKKLVTTYEPAIAMRWNAMLSGILNPHWIDDGDFEIVDDDNNNDDGKGAPKSSHDYTRS